MRKDVRTGAVIGGILIIVMIACGIVATRGHADKKKNPVVLDVGRGDAGGADRSDPAGSAPDDRPDPLVALTHEPPIAPAPSLSASTGHPDDEPAPAPPASDEKTATNWGALLSADHVEDVMPVRTHTPDARRTAADPAAAPTAPTRDAAARSRSADAPARVPLTDSPARATDRATDSRTAAPAPATAGTTHRVAEGETFSSIARDTYGNAKYYKEIIKANPKLDPTHLQPGMVISLPDKSQFKQDAAPAAPAGPVAGGSTEVKHRATTDLAAVNPVTEYRVQANDNLYKIATKLYHSANKMDAIYQLNKAAIGPDPAKLKLNMVLKLPEPPTQTASRQ